MDLSLPKVYTENKRKLDIHDEDGYKWVFSL